MRSTLKQAAKVASLVMVIGMCAGAYPQSTTPLTAPSVAGTLWIGTDSDGDHYEYVYIEGGAFYYTSPSGFHINGTWKQDGDTIYMETNNKFSEYQGRIAGGHIDGQAWNTQNHKWTWTAEKQNKPASAANGGVPTIGNTTWSVTESNGDKREFSFLPTGHLSYTAADGSVITLSWSQKVDAIDIWVGDESVGYQGRVTGGHMTGTANNNKGGSWTWSAERKD